MSSPFLQRGHPGVFASFSLSSTIDLLECPMIFWLSTCLEHFVWSRWVCWAVCWPQGLFSCIGRDARSIIQDNIWLEELSSRVTCCSGPPPHCQTGHFYFFTCSWAGWNITEFPFHFLIFSDVAPGFFILIGIPEGKCWEHQPREWGNLHESEGAEDAQGSSLMFPYESQTSKKTLS